jgi:hypothetical protein
MLSRRPVCTLPAPDRAKDRKAPRAAPQFVQLIESLRRAGKSLSKSVPNKARRTHHHAAETLDNQGESRSIRPAFM